MRQSTHPGTLAAFASRDRKKARGECRSCSSPVQYPGAHRCATCQSIHMDARKDRVTAGYCKDCWSHVRVNAHRCATCQSKKNAAERVRRGRTRPADAH